MFAAARLAAMRSAVADPARLEPLIEAPTFAEAAERLGELGIPVERDENGIDVEASLTAFLSARYAELEEFCPDTELADVCRLRYDCQNVKMALKCRACGLDPAGMMINCGTVPAERIAAAAANYQEGDFAFLPPAMAAAAARAVADCDATGATRVIDVLLDAACFADMLAYADAVGFGPVCELVRMKVDLTNLTDLLRILRMKKDGRSVSIASLMEDTLIAGGKIPLADLRGAEDKDAVASLAAAAGYARFAAAAAASDGSAVGISRIPAAGDADFLGRVREITHFRQLGAYPLIDYVISLEYEVHDLRIILSGKQTGADAQSIRDLLARG